MKVEQHKSSLGLDANIMAMLCYIGAFVLSWIPVIKYIAWACPLVFFLLEKQSSFVKFHAMQALILEAAAWVFQVVFGIIIAATAVSNIYNFYSYSAYRTTFGVAGVLGAILIIVELALTVFAIIALIKAYNYVEYKIPVVGNFAEKISHKVKQD